MQKTNERYVLVLRVPDVARSVVDASASGRDQRHGRVATLLAELGTGVVEREEASLGDLTAGRCRAIVFDVGDRIDHARDLLKKAHAWEAFRAVPSLVVLDEKRIADLDPGAGFTDFLVAPGPSAERRFASELYARIRQLEWRVSEFSSDERLKVGRLFVDRGAHEVRQDGVPVSLTRKEYALLLFLLERRGRIFSREALLQSVWGFDYEGGERTIDIHVQRLRKKLGEVLTIETVRGIGYRVQDEEPAPLKKSGSSRTLSPLPTRSVS